VTAATPQQPSGAPGQRRLLSPRLGSYLALALAGLIAALVSGRPELVALAAPFLVLPAVALAGRPPPAVELSLRVARERALEDEEVPLRLELQAGDAPVWVEVELRSPPAVALVGWDGRRSLLLKARERRVLELALLPRRWGAHRLPVARVLAWDRLRLAGSESALQAAGGLRVYPRAERLRALIDPRHRQLLVGSRVARVRGEGLEFAEIRPFAPGDRVRSVNWRASARRGVLHVNQRHPERNSDVILLLDTFEQVAAAGAGPGGAETAGTLDQALRAAVSLAEAHLRARDRVGVIGFGGTLNWLEPALGQRALYRIAEALVQTEIIFSYVWKTVELIPRRLLPAGALVIALTPLLDRRGVQALFDLRARGYDLAIVECSVEPLLGEPRSASERLARRLWRLEREALRARFRELGVAIAPLTLDRPLQEAIGEVIGFRRSVGAPARV
jgi:uncharacterized protein (DUF58 family)